MPEDSIRAFVAVEVPLHVLNLSEIGWLDSSYIRRVREDQMHITPAFFGSLPSSKVDSLIGALSGFSFAGFAVHVRGISTFSGIPRIIYADIAEGSGELKALSTRLKGAAATLRIATERREFVPHITIARVKDPLHSAEILARVREYADQEFGTFECSALKLKRSILKPEGPEYTDLFTIKALP